LNYGFVIDNRKCIGCHACSTACKSENQVPLGVNRTWVKYTETGRYPDTRRHFQVTRCNHCENPPCTRICPVTAMVQRNNGIVEFDGERCIGCKACMQACPYDAIYIDPETSTAAKCHYCAHRVENGMEPACVVVCPEHAIIAGDMDDPTSEIARVLAQNATTVRKPEQGTAPKLHYIEGHAASLVPTATEREPAAMMWSEVVPLHGDKPAAYTDQHHGRPGGPGNGKTYAVHLDFDGSGGLRVGQPQGAPAGGPITTGGGGTQAAHMVQQQVAYNAQHKLPWHWPVPAYLVTKGIGAGLPLLLALGVLGVFEVSHALAAIGGLVSLVFLGITTALLVFDLERPERFLRIVFQPQWRSWLTRGAFILIAFTNWVLAWTGLEAAAWFGMLDAVPGRALIAAGAVPLAIGAAVYTAFLFAQAEGRDLWQSPLLPVHLLVQAVMMGAGALVVISPGHELGLVVFTVALVVDLLVTLGGEFGIPHASEVAAAAAHMITKGRYKKHWQGSLWLGHMLPLALMAGGFALGMPMLAIPAAVLAAIGLYLYEYAFVMAPQEVPNS
jgi:Fe-S-cluster-containing dehydrogenase component/formate-dependent nitrite reductase membrane component NrfD